MNSKINEARIRYWYLYFSTNKCKDFIKDINCEKKKKKKEFQCFCTVTLIRIKCLLYLFLAIY